MYNVEKMGKFEVPNIRKRNDDALWLQMLKKEKYIYGMRSVLMKYRIRQNSISSNKFKVIKYHWILYRDRTTKHSQKCFSYSILVCD